MTSEFFHWRVEGWRGTRCARLQPPPDRTARTDSPYAALLWASHQGLCDLSPGALSGAAPILHPVVREQPGSRLEPLPHPPLQHEAPTPPRPHHMAPHLLPDPIPHEAAAPRRVANPEVVHPSTQDRVDHRDHPPHGLGAPASEYFLELPQQRRPLL